MCVLCSLIYAVRELQIKTTITPIGMAEVKKKKNPTNEEPRTKQNLTILSVNEFAKQLNLSYIASGNTEC